MSFKDIALPLVEMGVPVIRLQPKSKIPLDNGWQNLATTSVDQVLAWDAETPNTNCGSVAKPDNVLFLETDQAGVIQRFQQETGQSFKTFTVTSSPGHFHFYFKQTDESRALGQIKQGPGGIPFGSLRQNNAYVVSPGSIHPTTGKPYRIVDASPIIPIPSSLLEWLRNQTDKSSPVQKTDGPVQKVPHGQMHAALVSEAGRLRKYGYDGESIETALLAWAELHCDGGVDEQGRRRIHQYAQSMMNYKPDDPRLNYIAKVEPDIDIIPANAATPAEIVEETFEYPYWVWNGTLYEDFASLCGENNLVPKEYFIEAMKTVIGGICGHRITPYKAPSQESRFYTILIGPGGSGKSSAVKWALELFAGTGLVYDLVQQGSFTNIGCAQGSFASSSGLIKNGFSKHERILQVYDEASTLIEKFGITGSGDAFLDATNQLFESGKMPSLTTKDSKEDDAVTKKVHCSILGCTTKEKWSAAFGRTNSENSGFFQRLNQITTECEDRVANWVEPDLSVIRDRFVRKIQPLEYQQVVVNKTPEAIEKLEEWFKAKSEEWRALPTDVTGRLQVMIHRNASHLAWLMSGDDVVPNPETKEAIEVTCDEDIMERAIALAEYELQARMVHQPATGRNDNAVCENLIKTHLRIKVQLTRSKLYDMIHAEKFGIQTFDRSIANLTQEGFIRLAKKEGETKRGRKALIVEWIGSEE